MITPEKLREAFKRHRYGGGEYEPDYDLLDVAADEIERLRAALTLALPVLQNADWEWGNAKELQAAKDALGVVEQNESETKV